MDAVIFGIFAVVMTVLALNGPDEKQSTAKDIIAEDTTRTTKLNDSFYEDPNAFTEICSALGFPKK